MQCKGIIFDLDGTLLNTLVTLANSYNQALEEQEYPPHPTKSYKMFIGDGARKCVERCLSPIKDEAAINRVLISQQAIYRASWHQDTEPYADILPLLEILDRQGLKLAVLSNKDHEFTCKLVAHFFGEALFSQVLGYGEGIKHKPDPGGAIKIARDFGLSPAEMAFVGDSKMDIQTAIASGMVPIGVKWGFRSETELKQSGCKILLHQPFDLLNWLSE
ncbi:MAG: HAD family hydrolase [Gammaproteobacteria bacterium]|nr:HAD family hydrolase [Gammaproteobacteria bacterium]